MKLTSTRISSFLLLVTTILVTGCSTFERQAFNSEAATHVKKITVTQFNEQEEIPTFIINHPAGSFGLVGVAIVIADRNSKTKTMTEALDMNKTKVTTDFYAKAIPALGSLGYEVMPIAVKRGDKADIVLEAALKDQGQQAALSLGIDAAIVAAGATSDYYPMVSLGATLTDSKTKAVLFREIYQYGYNSGNDKIQFLAAAPNCKFKDMDALKANIDVTRKCVMDGVDALVNQLKNDLKK